MFIKPVSGSKEFIEKCGKKSVIAVTVLLGIVQGLLGMWKVNQIGALKNFFKIPYGKIFLENVGLFLSEPQGSKMQSTTKERDK